MAEGHGDESVVVLMFLERGYFVVSVVGSQGRYYELRRNQRTIVRADTLGEIADVIGQYRLDSRL